MAEKKPCLGIMYKSLLLNAEDNVAVALAEVPAHTTIVVTNETGNVQASGVNVLQHIPFAHKIAIRPINKDDPITKYGVPVAFATADIAVGEWVHTHNATSYLAAKSKGGNP